MWLLGRAEAVAVAVAAVMVVNGNHFASADNDQNPIHDNDDAEEKNWDPLI